MLGKHNFDISNEYGSVASVIRSIILHQDWDPNDPKYDSDIAVLILNRNVEFNNYIQPVCLPDPNYHNVIGYGAVVSWGKSEHTKIKEHEATPWKVIIPAWDSAYCFTTYPQLAQLASVRMFAQV